MAETTFYTTFSTRHFFLLQAKNGSVSGLWSAVSYRFGFNGKENDNEVKGTGNQQDYGMRIYDPRIARFLSADPLIVQGQQYPWYSPYQFAGNKPIQATDLDGLEEYVVVCYYQNAKLVGTALLHLPDDQRVYKDATHKDKYNGYAYVKVDLAPNTPFSTDQEKIDAMSKVTIFNFKTVYAKNARYEDDGFDPRETAMMKGLEKNFSEKYAKLLSYAANLFIVEPNPDAVQFETNSATLTDGAKKELDNLVFNMNLFPESTYEIAAHTDNVGNDESNQTLSEQRAKSVVDYLIGQGIDASRLTSNGYGETQPRADNATEEGRSRNRRVEYNVTNKGY
jgi:RHS repeat-associated protein